MEGGAPLPCRFLIEHRNVLEESTNNTFVSKTLEHSPVVLARQARTSHRAHHGGLKLGSGATGNNCGSGHHDRPRMAGDSRLAGLKNWPPAPIHLAKASHAQVNHSRTRAKELSEGSALRTMQ
jgi:hypothetical protein